MVHSQFVFEGALGNLKKRVLGSRGYLTQTVRKIFYQSSSEVLLKEYYFSNIELYNIAKSIEDNSSEIREGLLGPFKTRELKDIEKRLFTQANKTIDPSALTSTRCVVNYEVNHSRHYGRRGNSNSYTVCFKYKNLVSSFFVKLKHLMKK
jgi:hypothetical protein